MNYPAIIVVILLVVGGNVLSGWEQRQDLMEIRSRMNLEHSLMEQALASKVDTKTREAMLSDLNHRLGSIEAAIGDLDRRVEVLTDLRKMGALGTMVNPAVDKPRRQLVGIDCPNLSGTGSPAAIAYQRQRRDRLRPQSLNLSGIPWEP
jgi:hypothetical protein